MPFCPSCKEEFREGFDWCRDCEQPLVASLAPEPGRRTVVEEEERYAERLFERLEDPTHFCPNCYVEFVSAAARCEPCGGARLATVSRVDYERAVGGDALDAFRTFDLPVAAEDLARIWLAEEPAEAGFVVESLAGMGVDAEIGNDALDDDLADPAQVGVWVPTEQVEACEMILPEDPAEWRSDDSGKATDDPYVGLVRNAQAYADIQKFRHAVELARRAIEIDLGRADAFFVLGQVLGRLGDVKHAVEAFQGAAERLGAHDGSDAAFFVAVYSFLDEKGEVSFEGARADTGLEALKGYVRRRPRTMAGLKLLLQAQHARRANREVGQIADLMAKVAPYMFRIDGLHRQLTGR